ncbi:UbiA family prenyltransferase [Pseudogemmobacter sonorensis]|uniref:UbiA family prenyltransferase n=1 Tax=Pseudogemmobacter sonorensis TaxID=2989681 RepID=UPI0036B33E3A
MIPLVVDLDGTLCRSDTLFEAVLRLVGRRPAALPGLVAALFRGRRAFKAHVADRQIADPATLPWRPEVLALIESARAEGRRVELVSAADQRQVEAVAAHLGLFDAAIGTTPPAQSHADPGNLKGPNKATLLRERHGEKGFDYVGDSASDLAVWSGARRAIVVAPSPGLLRRMRAAGLTPEPLGAAKGRLKPALQAMRPHQWAKNVLVFVPALAAHDPWALLPALAAFVAFSIVASGVYLLNDLLDLGADRIHPRKRFRPLASGDLPIPLGLGLAALLFALGMAISAVASPGDLLGVLAVYVVATSAYSFWLKRKMMIDIVGLAGLYTLRIWAGAVATGIELSNWLLVFSMFFFFSLAAMKRQAELADADRNSRDAAASGRNLHVDDLATIRSMSIASGQIAVLVFGLYAMDPMVRALYSAPDLLLLVCPLLFFWIGRLQVLTQRGFMADDPLVFVMRDRVSLLVLGLIVLLILATGF